MLYGKNIAALGKNDCFWSQNMSVKWIYSKPTLFLGPSSRFNNFGLNVSCIDSIKNQLNLLSHSWDSWSQILSQTQTHFWHNIQGFVFVNLDDFCYLPTCFTGKGISLFLSIKVFTKILDIFIQYFKRFQIIFDYIFEECYFLYSVKMPKAAVM